jgi:hypothetical protein
MTDTDNNGMDHPDEWDNPTLEDALDGLYAAHVYCLSKNNNELASEIFDTYQQVAKSSTADSEQ